MKKNTRIAILVFAACAMTGVGYAQVTLTDIGATVPTPGPNDISQLLTNGNTKLSGSFNYYTDNSTPPGQTFTTGTKPVILTSVSLRTGSLPLDSGNGGLGPQTYQLRIFSVSGSSAVLLNSYTSSSFSYTDGHWLQWTNLAVPFATNTTYAYTFRRSSSGYDGLAVASGNRYAGGEAALIPNAGGTITFESTHGYDAAFVIGLSTNSSQILAGAPTVSPASTLYISSAVTLGSAAIGDPPLYYQWQTDGGSGGTLTNIPNATNANLTVTLPSTGTFKFDYIVTNASGSANSSVAAVTVLSAAAVTVNPAQTMAAMPLEGLGVDSAVYDNYLVSAGTASALINAGIKAVRYPGGSYADIVHWQTCNSCGGYTASGACFDNWINNLVTPAGAKAIITVNYGSNPTCNAGGDTNEAAAWVYYANVTRGLQIKYWEIGNEQGGNGYYGVNLNWEEDLHYPALPAANRVGQPLLSPTAYGSNSLYFMTAMKAQDSSIKCGVGFDTGNSSYNTAVLGQCGSLADFVIIHWYPGGNATALLATPGQIGSIVNNTRTQLTNNVGAAHAAQMGIAITETGPGNVTGAPAALFTADDFLTWIENGIVNVDYQELHNGFLSAGTPGVADNSLLAPAYGAKMARLLANVGDTFLKTTSAQSELHVHATARQDGKTGIMFINTDPNISIAAAVNISGPTLARTGIRYQFGLTNFIGANLYPSYPISTNTMPGLGNSFTVSVPPYTMVDLLLSPAGPNTPPVLNPIGNQTTNVGGTVAFTASASDSDSPPQTLTFSLLSGPGNATVDTYSGAFSWRPLVTQANTTNLFALQVADDGIPSMSATQGFTVTVNPLTVPSAVSLVLNNGQLGFQISGQTGPDYAVQVSSNLFAWSTLFITNSPAMPFSWTDTNPATLPAQFYRIKVGPPLP